MSPRRSWFLAISLLLVVGVACCQHEPTDAGPPEDAGVGYGPRDGLGGSGTSECGNGGYSFGNPYQCCDNGGNCTWFAWKSATEAWGAPLSTSSWGDAGNWYAAATAYPRGAYPAPGALAVLRIGDVGHVAMVTAVNIHDQYIEVREMNCCGPWNSWCKLGEASARAIAGPRLKKFYDPSKLIGFIFPKGVVPPTAWQETPASAPLATSVVASVQRHDPAGRTATYSLLVTNKSNFPVTCAPACATRRAGRACSRSPLHAGRPSPWHR